MTEAINQQSAAMLTSVQGVMLHQMQVISDAGGTLSVGEFPRDLPFAPVRYFLVYGVPGTDVRGNHAHHACHQLLICVRGSLIADADDGMHRESFSLDRPDLGLYVPPMVWASLRAHSADALLLVLASERYDPEDYIRDYQEFRSLLNRQ